jgi:glycosyltransferase involved in cell wall biosynthesis
MDYQSTAGQVAETLPLPHSTAKESAASASNGHAAIRAGEALVLSVVLPVYNELATIREIIQRVRNVDMPKQIVMVDDCSTDGTRDVLKNEYDGKYPDIVVIYHEKNQGKGAAIRTAIGACTGDLVIIQDADLEYDPDQYHDLVEPVLKQGAEIVYGSRFMNNRPKDMALPNRVVNWLLARMVRVLYGSPMTDEATCYKLFKREVLTSIPLTCQRFEFCPEVTAKALRRGHKIVEVPIKYEPRSHADGKKIRWTDGVDAIYTLLRYRFWK